MTLLRIAVDAPIWDALDYLHPAPLSPGSLVRVPLGRQTVLGVVLQQVQASAAPEASLRAVSEVYLALPALDADWLALLHFAASYYQRPLGELMAAALPTWLRDHGANAAAKRVAAWRQRREPRAFRLTPAGRDALAQELAPRHAALWRLAAALGLQPLPRAEAANNAGANRPDTADAPVNATAAPACAATAGAAIHDCAAPPLPLDVARKLHPKAAACCATGPRRAGWTW